MCQAISGRDSCLTWLERNPIVLSTSKPVRLKNLALLKRITMVRNRNQAMTKRSKATQREPLENREYTGAKKDVN
jgi:hypothetical protein